MTRPDDKRTQPSSDEQSADASASPEDDPAGRPKRAREVDGPLGPEPTRYGDWEVGGRCIDF